MFRGINENKGTEVLTEESFEYALKEIQNGSKELKKEFIEWFFSGNWIEDIKEEEEEL
jgi:hypothetical protein